MNKKTLLQIMMISIFLIIGLLTLFKVVNLEGIVAIVGLLCSAMYLLFSFWLMSEKKSSLILKVVFGIVYSILVLALTYCFLSFAGFQLVAAFAFYFSLMLIMVCVILIKNEFFKQHLFVFIGYIILIIALFFRI